MSPHYIPAFVLGILVTLGLFCLMQSMILNSESALPETRPLKIVEFVRLKREDPLTARKRILPEKPPPAQKPSPPKMKTAQTDPAAPGTRIEVPDLDLPAFSARIDGSMTGGLQMGSGAGGGTSNLVPIFRIPPRYPMRAEKRRIEGWVRVEFTVDERGLVADPVVVESHPDGIFDRAAVQAVSKWKFKPKIIGGIVVEQRAVQLLEFKLSK